MMILINSQQWQQYQLSMIKYPSTSTKLSKPVLQTLKNQFMHYQDTPFCFVETSHRSKAYDNLNNMTIQIIKKYFDLQDYEVLLMPTGSAMPSLFFNIIEQNTGVYFLSEGLFSEAYYQQMKKYHPKTQKINKTENLHALILNKKLDQNILIHYNRIQDGYKVRLPLIEKEQKQKITTVMNINYCFPWKKNYSISEDVVYFESHTGFSVPGFTVIMLKRQLANKIKIWDKCPDMFNLPMMIKMKSVVNTPFTVCTLVLYQNIKYAHENTDIIEKNVLNNKRIYIEMLKNSDCCVFQEQNKIQQQEKEQASNFIRIKYRQRNQEFLNQIQPYCWINKQQQELFFFIQNQNIIQID